ncbi:hypothetical protein D9758_004164 [Tetrapyrgos nigripes]|uniref:beta-glucosidase n=1 Tax=Tetrapyrgos nigripes TaxID=182062 RepID=A0A8H5GUI6_9AGAR|nr:hypothetical protein D9758_004164 [Tetrapyrgos nigripes]
MHLLGELVFLGALLSAQVSATWTDPSVLDACPGYTVSNVVTEGPTLNADLTLAGEGCNVFGTDIPQLSLSVTYETDARIHLKISDPSNTRYEVPESVFPRPNNSSSVSPSSAQIQFNYTESPFSFTIFRTSTSEVLFSTANHALIFESQYLRVKTSLPKGANIYGLGEHTNPFRLPTTNTILTLWSRDSYEVPIGSNLYGNHPVYFEHRTTGTHGVFLLNSNGMDIKINDTESDDQVTLEYNVIGGILDFYFLAGSENDPLELAKQYAEVVGVPAEVPYWSFGLHQCRFGYNSFVDVADVVTNYSAAQIPLETMWTDIDYMQGRRIFTVDPNYFPLARVRDIVDYLHQHDQKYILMTDPAVAYTPDEDYAPYHRGTEMDVWLKLPNGSFSLGLVWPGVTVYPDWFHPDIQTYWNNEFETFYNPESGIDIDGAWIDMNEPSSFCFQPCTDIFNQAIQQALPPPRTAPIPDPNTPIFVNSSKTLTKRVEATDNIMDPPYEINNAADGRVLSAKTAWVNSTHANGLVEYDTHNIYGSMMSVSTHLAMLARRPGLRTLVITRSTFAGAGRYVGKWLGDNFSSWGMYRQSIAGMLGFASIYQVPMVGSDICGYAENTTETLCARWAMLGGFYPFMRNHNSDTSISQEYYRWPLVAEAARNVLDIRYRLMDYLYTAFHTSHLDGTPLLQPLFFKYPKDPSTYLIDLQFLYGPSILVSPVTEENSTSVTIYLPNDTFYDFLTFEKIEGQGANHLGYKSPRAMTTTELRQRDFEILIAPGTDGTAKGSLYVDDGESIDASVNGTTEVEFSFGDNVLTVNGTFGFDLGVSISRVRLLGASADVGAKNASVNGLQGNVTTSYDAEKGVVDVEIGVPFDKGFEVVWN